MEFKEYYQNKEVVERYDSIRRRGIKAPIVRKLEYDYVDELTEPVEKILEIGVGTGFISQLLVKKGKFYGVDISNEMLRQTKKRLAREEITLGTADILNLNIKKRFDEVVTIRVISHLDREDAKKALVNVNNILKKDGKIIFNLENKSLFRRIARKFRNWGSTYTFQYSKKEMNKLASESGYKIEEIIYLDHLFIYPFHLINWILFRKLDSFLINLEKTLRHIKFMSNNSFLKCKKSS
jgi:ubiquinone/menaquinone biosynthesis C-methylase UbiE